LTAPGTRPACWRAWGRCALAAADAKDGLRQALDIFQRIGAAEAVGVASELDALTEARAS
jgi:hypothetical protein